MNGYFNSSHSFHEIVLNYSLQNQIRSLLKNTDLLPLMAWICCSAPLYFCRWGWRRVDAVLVFCRGFTLTAALPGGFREPFYSQTLYVWQQLVSTSDYSDVPSVWACGRHDLSCHHCNSHLQKNQMEMKTSFPSCGSPSIETVIGRARHFKLEDKILKIPFYLITKT